MLKTCNQCGRPFQPYRPLQGFCSPECRREAKHEWEHRHYLKEKAARPIPTRHCIVCGREFQPPTHCQKARICSEECRRQRKHEYDAEYHREHRADRKEYNRQLLDYLAHLEETYGKLPNGRIKRLILSWRNDDD